MTGSLFPVVQKATASVDPAGMIPIGMLRGTGSKSCDIESNMASRCALMRRPLSTS